MVITADPTVDVPGAAAILKVHENRVLRLIEKGTIPATKYGRAWVIPTAPLVQLITDQALADQQQRRQPARNSGGRRLPPPELPSPSKGKPA